MSDQAPPKIEFPCAYPIKVVGDACDNFQAVILAVIKKHAPELDLDTLSERSSSGGNYQSLTVTIQAQGTAQLEALFTDLKATGIVRLVL